MEGIDEQFGEYHEQVMAIGLDGQFIAHMAVEVHLCSMGEQAAGAVEGFAGQIVAADGVVGADGLLALDERGGEQLAYHVVEGIGLHIHGLGYLALVFLGHQLTSVAQHLRESVNDIEWCTDLVRHVLHELCLLLTGLARQLGGLLELRGALLGFLFGLLCFVDVLADAAPHLAEAVLQLSYQVGALTGRQALLIVAVTYLAQFGSEQSQRLYEVSHDAVASPGQQQQSDEEQGQQDVVQAVVAAEQLVGGADEGHAPLRAFEGAVEHDVLLAVEFHFHVACAPVGHLVAQCHDVGVLFGIGAGEDGLLEQFRGVGVNEVVAVGAQHHEVGVGVGMLCVDGLREPLQRQVCGDDADELLLSVEERDAVGGDQLGV